MKYGKSLLLGGILVVSFQNCSKVNFTPTDAGTLASTSSVDHGDDPVNVVCDPFSSGSTCSVNTGAGLLGNVYYLPNGVGVQDYIDNGTKLNIYVQMTNLNIPNRAWTDGFPGSDGNLIQDPSGAPLIEYFALDLKGYLKINSNQAEGDYQFATASDDGSILDIDGKTVVNNDGWHSVTWKCADDAVNLKRGDAHPMRLRYYQGPRVYIALQVFYRPYANKSQACDASGGWTVVPPEVLFH